MTLKQVACASCLHAIGDHDEWGCIFCDCLDQYITHKENN